MYRNHNATPPLVSAVLNKNVVEVKRLLEQNSDHNIRIQGALLVDVAARGGDLATTKLLVGAGATVSSNALPLIQNPKIIKYLESRGAMTDKFKLAVNQGKWEDVKTLGLQGVDVNMPVDDQGNRLSHILLGEKGGAEELQTIANVLKLDMNAKNNCNETPLDVASKVKFVKDESFAPESLDPEIKELVDLVRGLMMANAGKEFFETNGLSEIYAPLISGQSEAFKTLIKCNADPGQALLSTQQAIKGLGLSNEFVKNDNPEIEEIELTGNSEMND